MGYIVTPELQKPVKVIKSSDIVVSREVVLQRIDDAISRTGHIMKDLRDLRADVVKLTTQRDSG